MLQNRPSRTLLSTAIRRATHQLLDHPIIFNDPVALRLVPEALDSEIVAALSRDGTTDPAALRSLFAMRSRFVEDCLAEAAQRGVRQYVILAAGLDTFPWRQPDYAQVMQLFAVDHPASLAFARERILACKLPMPSNLVQVAVDLEERQLGNRLHESGFDFAVPSFVSMLGVVQYLTREAVDSLFELASTLPAGSETVFSFAVSEEELKDGDREAGYRSAAFTASIGEPWQTRLRPRDLVVQLERLGFRRIFHLTPELAQRRYFSNRRDVLSAPGWEQLIAAAV
jgi:methyltransferase (TIGR00027 family)